MVKQRVMDYITHHQEEAVALLSQFVQEESIQGKEAGIQRLVVTKLEELGLEIDVWEPSYSELEKHPYFGATRTSFAGSPNVVGVLKGSGGGKSLILNGHIDVVPEGDLAQWKGSPFSGRIQDGRVYGRGTTDMKGGNVSLLLAIEAIKKSGIMLKGDVIFQSVIEEESGGAGTLAAILRGYHADGAIIPEPTQMKVFPKQQGSTWFRLIVSGKSAHGGTRYEGVSAIEKAMSVIEYILLLEKKRNERVKDPLYRNIPIPLPINIGVIKGGQWPSSVCDEVILEGRYGMAPNEEIEVAKKEFEDWINALSIYNKSFEDYPIRLEWFGAHWLPGNLECDHPLFTQLVQAYEEIVGEEPIVEASPWGTDGGFLSVVGKIPTIVFGPGITKMAHYSNEYIEIEKMIQCAKVIASFMIDWCGVEGDDGQ